MERADDVVKIAEKDTGIMDTLAGWPSTRRDIPDDVAFHFGADRAIGTAHDVGLEDRASSH